MNRKDSSLRVVPDDIPICCNSADSYVTPAKGGSSTFSQKNKEGGIKTSVSYTRDRIRIPPARVQGRVKRTGHFAHSSDIPLALVSEPHQKLIIALVAAPPPRLGSASDTSGRCIYTGPCLQSKYSNIRN